MTNSISFSSDMTKMYLIDDGRCIPFDLTRPNGVLVGLIKDQVAVVTAAKAIPDNVPGKTVNNITFSTKDSQFTVVYHEMHTTMFVIGALDIDSAIAAGDDEPKTRIKSLNLSQGAVNIKRVGTNIEFTYLS